MRNPEIFFPIRWLALLVLIHAAPGPTTAQPSSAFLEEAWIPNGKVEAVAVTNGLAYIGGSFQIIGPACGGLAGVDAETGSLRVRLPDVRGKVFAMIPDGAGGLFLAGDFIQVGSIATTNIAHLTADHQVDPLFTAVLDYPPSDILLVGDRLFVAGLFTQVNGQPRGPLAELDPRDGSLRPLDMGIQGQVRKLATDGKRLFMGGVFTTVSLQPRLNVAALELSNNSVSSWRADCKAADGFPSVLALAVDGDHLLVGGHFDRIGTTSRAGAGAVNLSTAAVLAWNPHLAAQAGGVVVNTITVGDSAAYLFGSFDAAGGQPRSHACAVNRTDAGLMPWVGSFDAGSVITALQIADTLAVAGTFSSLNTGSPAYLAMLDATTGKPRPWTANITGPPAALVWQAGTLFTAGDFDSLGGMARTNLACIDLTTGTPTAWSPAIAGGAIYQLKLQGQNLYLGGQFTSVNGQDRVYMAAVDRVTGVLASTPSGSWTAGFAAVEAFLNPAGTRVFGRRWDGTHAVVNTDTGAVSTWDPVDPAGFAAAATDGKSLFVSGNFPKVGGAPRSMLAAFDLETRQLTPWAPTLDLPAAHLYSFDRMLVATGTFTRANGEPRNGFAIFDTITGRLSAVTADADGQIAEVTFSPNSLYLAGDFYHLNGVPRAYYGAVDRLAGAARDWAMPPLELADVIYPRGHIAIDSENLVVVGGFSRVGNRRHARMAVFPVTNAPPMVTLGPSSLQVDLALPGEAYLPLVSSTPPGRVVRVDTLVDGQVVSSAPGLPSELHVPELFKAGDYAVSAAAYDETGEFAISPAVSLTAHPPASYVTPTLQILTPTNGGVYAHDIAFKVTPGIVDPSRGVQQVTATVLTNQTAPVRVLTADSPPWEMTSSTLQPGVYSLVASLKDQYGLEVTNTVASFRVNRPPTCFLSLGSNVLYVENPIRVGASATDKDGKVVLVELYDNGRLIGTSTKSPLSVVLSSPALGNHTFQAVAVDDFGARTASVPQSALLTYTPPTNDHASGPAPLAGNAAEATGTNRHATQGGDDPTLPVPAPTHQTVWWQWQAPWTGRAFASTRGSGFNTVLAVIQGQTPPFTPLDANGDEASGVTWSRVEFDAVSGKFYTFDVDGENGESGDIMIRVGPVVRITAVIPSGTAGSQIQASLVPGISYRLESSGDLEHWTAVATQRPQATPASFVDPASQGVGPRFYRMVVVP